MAQHTGNAPGDGWTIDTVGDELLACEAQRRDRVRFTDEWPELDLATGYAIQDRNLAARLERGEKLVGVKLGLTSRAKQQQMGVHSPFVAWLTDAMVLPAGDPVPQGIGSSTRGSSRSSPSSWATGSRGPESPLPGRWRRSNRSGAQRRSSTRAIATSPSAPATSSPTTPPRAPSSPARSDCRRSRSTSSLEAVLVEIGGAVVDSATGAAVQGHPGEALALAANELAGRGHAIEAGWIVLTGGMTEAVACPPGASVALHFTHLGSVFLNGGA
jgi:2-oxo-3-hexenedioate decarboxylase